MRVTSKSKRALLVILFVALSVVVEGLVIFLNIRRMDTIQIGDVSYDITSFKGILQSVISLLCVVAVTIDHHFGRRLSTVVLSGTLVYMLFTLMMSKNWSVLPGVSNTIIALLSVQIIASQMKKLEKSSITDDVTGVLNRHGFMHEIVKLLEDQKLGYVMFIEFQGIRNVNESFGHAYGDMVLRMAAERLKASVGEKQIISRMDGTEFAVSLRKTENVDEVCKDIIDNLSRKITLITLDRDDTSVNCYLNPYIGISRVSEATNTVSLLMKHADIAVYNATKKQEKICFYSDSFERDEFDRSEMIRMVRESLDRNYFYLNFQPQYEAETRKLRGFETLIRCNYKFNTQIYPDEFIPVAEATNMIYDIDNYVLNRAMKEMLPLLEKASEKFIVSINVSAKSMSSADFLMKVEKALERTGFPADCLEIEITEYSFSESKERTISNVLALREKGIRIALDDFGTGYTSLAQLLKLPVNLLKIDKSLVDDIVESRVDRDFLDSVIYMGHLMSCEVIAEGVETELQLQLLREHKCDYIQGFVWGKPMELKDAARLLE